MPNETFMNSAATQGMHRSGTWLAMGFMLLVTYATNADEPSEPRLTLDQLMEKVAEHERNYARFHIKATRETTWISDELKKAIRSRPGSPYAEASSFTGIYIQGKPGEFYFNHFRADEPMATTPPGVAATPKYGRRDDTKYGHVDFLKGVFPLDRNKSPLLSTIYKEQPSGGTQLAWDDQDAVISLAAKDANIRLWLAANRDWHPVKMEFYPRASDDQIDLQWMMQWSVESFFPSTATAPRIRTGQILWRDYGLGDESPNTSTDDRKVILSERFEILEARYGDDVDSKLFDRTLHPSQVSDSSPEPVPFPSRAPTANPTPKPQNLGPSLNDPPPYPTVEDIRKNRRFDWLILKDDKIIVVEPVEPRPDTLAKIKAEIETLTTARGGLTSERKARQDRIQELQWLTVTLLEHPGTEYKLKIDQIKEIRHFEDLVRERAKELSTATDDDVAAKGRELLAGLRDSERRHKNLTGNYDSGEARVVVRDMLLMAGQFVDVQLSFPDGRNQVLPHVQIEALTSRIERTIQRVDSQKEFPQVTQESVVHEAVLKLTPVQQESFAQAKSRKILRTVDHPDAAHAWDAENSGQPSKDRQPEERETVERVATPFVGEWRLRSVEHDDYAKSIRSSEELAAADKALRTNVFIRENQLHFGDDLFEFAFQKVNSFTWQVIEPEHLKNSVVLEQLGTILRVESMPLEGITRLVFGKVDPERDALVRQIAETTAQLTAARIDGPQRAISQLEAHLALLNERLQRLDQIPEVDSLQLDALIARDAGDHAEAAKLEAEAKTLADRNRSHDSSGENHQQETIESPTDENEIQRLTDELQRTEIASTTRAQQLRELELSGDGFKGDVETIETELKRLVTKAFDLRWQIQDLRLKKSRVNLWELESKHRQRKELADQIIERRLEALRNGDETAWLQTNSDIGRAEQHQPMQNDSTDATVRSAPPTRQTDAVPSFKTPDELLQYIGSSETAGIASLQRYVEQLTEEETQRVAGVALRTIAGLKGIAGLFAVFGSQDGDDTSKETFGRIIADLSAVLDQHLIDNPPAAATAAHKRIQPNLNPMTAFLGITSTTIVPAARYSETLRTAAGVLDDPRAFLSDILAAATAMEKEFGGDQGLPEKPDWNVTLSGDKATAIDLNAEDSNENAAESSSSPIKPSASIELTKINGVWRISSVLTDEAILELQKGFEPKVSESSGSESAETTAPVVMATPSAPVTNTAGYSAKNDLDPFTKLTSSDVRVSTGSPFDDGNGLKASQVFGRYVNQRVKSGEDITEAMLVDKPTVQQIVDVYIAEALAGHPIFRKPRSDSAFPYRDGPEWLIDLPDWTSAYVESVAKRLNQKPGIEWGDEEFRLVASLEPLVFDDFSDSPVSLDPLVECLRQNWPIGKLSEELQAQVSPMWHSSLMLGMAVRLPDVFRDEMFDMKVNVPKIQAKLKLLNTMCTNKAEYTWIQQDQVRLANLSTECPLPALESVLKGNWAPNMGIASHWLYALASEEQYHASLQREATAAPIDIILVLLTMERLVGDSKALDEQISCFFPHGAGSSEASVRHTFMRQLQELIRSKRHSRKVALDALVEIYRHSKSENLTRSITMIAPSVPVTARQLDADVVEHMVDGKPVGIGGATPIPRDAASIRRTLVHAQLISFMQASPEGDERNSFVLIDPHVDRRRLANLIAELIREFPNTPVYELSDPKLSEDLMFVVSPEVQSEFTARVAKAIHACTRPYAAIPPGFRKAARTKQSIPEEAPKGDYLSLRALLKGKRIRHIRLRDWYLAPSKSDTAQSLLVTPDGTTTDNLADSIFDVLADYHQHALYVHENDVLIVGQPYENYEIIAKLLRELSTE